MARKGEGIGIVEGWQGGLGGEDFLRELVERTVQQVLEAEMASFLGAGSYERNGERRGWRNGYKPRTLKTRVGGLELMVPKDRDGEFQTELFERYQRSEKALVLAMLQMYVEGVSTRKVSAITEALCGLEVSKSQVSALTAKLDAEVAAWRSRPLTEEYPYLIFDARYEKVRRGGAVVSQGVLVAIGISAAGCREVLGCWVAESESEASWGAVFAELKQRGLSGVRYVVSDDHAGMVKAIGRHFQCAVWQRCQGAFRAQRAEPVRRAAASAGAAPDAFGDRSADARGRQDRAGSGDRRVREEGPQGGAVAGGTRRRDPGRIRSARGAPQTDADHQHAGAPEPGVETQDQSGEGVSQRTVVPAAGRGAADGDQSGVDGQNLPEHGGGDRDRTPSNRRLRGPTRSGLRPPRGRPLNQPEQATTT